MQEIRRQNDVERWRNKLRLQEKFEVMKDGPERSGESCLFSSNAMPIL